MPISRLEPLQIKMQFEESPFAILSGWTDDKDFFILNVFVNTKNPKIKCANYEDWKKATVEFGYFLYQRVGDGGLLTKTQPFNANKLSATGVKISVVLLEEITIKDIKAMLCDAFDYKP